MVTTVVSAEMTTEDKSHMATVVTLNSTIVRYDGKPVETEPEKNLTTVDIGNVSTVDEMLTVDTSLPPLAGPLWVSEEGSYIPPKKVRRVRSAQDALSSAEQAVYELLWSQPGALGDASSRTVQAGYDFIVKRARLSKKTVQRIVAKLIEKDFLAIEIPADIYTRTSTTYRVYSQRAVLDRMTARNRLFVAKVGPGVVHVRPM